LETLGKNGVKATFFILGRYACRHPEVMREIAAGRHEFGNHSFFHPLFTDLSPITSTLEITYTEAAIDWAIGQHVPMRYFRFPYGRGNRVTRMHLASMGYQSAFWDIDPRGWDPTNSPEDVVEHVRRTAHPGGIVIMHCGSWDDANALADVIRVIREKGLIPGMLSDVLAEADRNVPGYSPP
jgi:peptidoglycan/xylan/chitin deacetylase (PgdA/CDA1 family)